MQHSKTRMGELLPLQSHAPPLMLPTACVARRQMNSMQWQPVRYNLWECGQGFPDPGKMRLLFSCLFKWLSVQQSLQNVSKFIKTLSVIFCQQEYLLRAFTLRPEFLGFCGTFITNLSFVATLHSSHLNSQSNADWKSGSAQLSIASRSGKAKTGVSSLPERHKHV